MRLLIILLFTPFTVAGQQSLHLDVGDLGRITRLDSALVYEFIDKSPKVVYLTSKATDSIFFNLINQYRISHNAKALPRSGRLDTLAHIVLLKNTSLPELTHYPKIPELSSIIDLLNVENLSKLGQFDLKVGARSLNFIIGGWDQSPRHQRSLVASLGESDIGAAHVILKVEYHDNRYHYKLYAIYELDNKFSKREIDEKYRQKNEELWKRPIKIKPKQ